MVLLGVGLALASAIAHAAWNTIVKQVSAGGLAALWAYTLGSSTLAIGVLLAATIAAYSTYDGWAIVSLGLDPLPYITVSTVMQLLLVTALLRGDVRSGLVQLRRHPRPIVVLAVLIPASYALGLVATQHAPVSVVTAVRSSSIVWAAAAAVVVLREPMRRGRLAATLLCSMS